MTPPKKLAVLECCPKPLWRKRKQRSPLRFPAGRRHNVKPCVPENTLATEAWRPMATAAADAAVARWSICAKSLDKSCLSGSRRGANTGLPSRLGAHRPCRGRLQRVCETAACCGGIATGAASAPARSSPTPCAAVSVGSACAAATSATPAPVKKKQARGVSRGPGIHFLLRTDSITSSAARGRRAGRAPPSGGGSDPGRRAPRQSCQPNRRR